MLSHLKVTIDGIQAKTPDILIDSGAAAHVFKDEAQFISWDTDFDPKSVTFIMADGTQCSNIVGKGTVSLQLSTKTSGERQQIILKEVYFMPTLNHSGIISVKSGMEQGILFRFVREGSYMKVNGFIFPFSIKHSLFYVNSARLIPTVRRTAREWHAILGHVSYKALHKTPAKVEGMIITHSNKRHCVPCIRNKCEWQISRTPDLRAKSPMSFIHLDIGQPHKIGMKDSYGGFNYFISIVCDFSGFLYVVPLVQRADAIDAFREFVMFSKRFGPITRLRTDNAGELTSHAFNNLCYEHGISREYSVSHTSNMNGTAERSLKTLHMKSRAMLNTCHIGHKYWPYAYQYAAFVYNRTWMARIDRTPYSLLYDAMPNLSKLRRFGSTVYAHKYNHEITSKLDPRANGGAFLGFNRFNGGVMLLEREGDDPKTYPYIVSSNLAPDSPLSEQESADDDMGSVHSDTDISTTPHTTHQNSPVGATDGYTPLHSTHGGTGLRTRGQSRGLGHHQSDHHENSHLRDTDTPSTEPGGVLQVTRSGRPSRPPSFFGVNSIEYMNLNCNKINSSKEIFDVICNVQEVNNLVGFQKCFDPHLNVRQYNNYCSKANICKGQLQSVVTDDNISMDQRFHISALELCHNVNKVPKNYEEAMASCDSSKWQAAMKTELESLKRHNTYKLVKRPANTDIIKGRWVYSNKEGIDGTTIAKARWVAKGFMQCYGDSYRDTYAPMSRMSSLRIIMSMVAQYGFIAHQLDVTTAYLNAELDHEIFMEQPHGTASVNDSRVCYLYKSLYGLKQSAKLWNDTIHSHLTTLGFKRNAADMCLYQRTDSRGTIFLIIWVDDVVIAAENRMLVDQFVKAMKSKFLIKDLGKLRYFLGIEFDIGHNYVTMSQSKYLKFIVERFKMQEAFYAKSPMVNNIHHELKYNADSEPLNKAETTRYRELVGSLIYLEQTTRPDLSIATNILGQQMAHPTQFHWNTGKKVLRYLLYSQNHSLTYRKTESLCLFAYSDADFANETRGRKSQSGYITFLSPTNSPISWASRKQGLCTDSTTYAEYVAMAEAACELVWLQTLFKSLNYPGISYAPAVLWADNQGAQALTENPRHHSRTKHIDIKFHHIRDLVSRGVVDVKYVRSADNIADGLTKPLGPNKFKDFVKYCLGNNA